MSLDALGSAAHLRDGAQAAARLWKLPSGWCWTSLEEITSLVAKVDPAKRCSPFTYIDLSAIEGGTIRSAQQLQPREAPSRARQLVQRDDTLFSGVRVYLKNIALVSADHDRAIASTAFCVLRPSKAIDARYLYHFVNWQPFISSLLPLQRGNSPPAVLDADIKAQRVPLPPLHEQRRIIARIDEFFAEIDEGEAALERARRGHYTWRRALLYAAVTGELTPGWRKANRPTETGVDLVARIRLERGFSTRVAISRRRASNFEQLDASVLPDLPEGWTWARMGEIVRDNLLGLDRNAASQREGPSGTAYIKMNNISMNGSVDLNNLVKIAANSEEIARYKVEPGDVLFNTRNGLELVGKTGIVRDLPSPTVFNNNILRLRFRNGINPEFICIQMCSPPFRQRLQRIKKATTSVVAAIYQADLLALPIAIPSTAEQSEIASLIGEHGNQAREAITLINQSTGAETSALRQAILRAAFEGRLVPQDAADEPASVLLARLRDRDAAPPPSRRRGRQARLAV